MERTETYYQESSKCTVSHGFEEDEPSFFDRSMAAGTVTQGDYFGIDEKLSRSLILVENGRVVDLMGCSMKT